MTISLTFTRRFILFLTILISGGNLLFPRLFILGVVVFCYFIYFKGQLSLKVATVPIVFLLTLLFIISIFHPYSYDISSLTIRFANFFAAFLLLDIYLKHSLADLKRDLYVLMKFMPLQAILTVVLATYLNFLFIDITTDSTSFYSFLGVFNYHITIDNGALIRPNGFFFEPGVFQLYLNLFLYLSLFVYKNKVNSCLAIIAILLTKSSTGVLILAIILGWYFIRYYINKGSLLKRFTRLIIAVVLFLGFVFLAWDNINDKMHGEARGSFLARQYDTITGFNVAVANPFLGVGFKYDNYYAAAEKLGYRDTLFNGERTRNRDNTNGIVMLFYSIGTPLALIFVFGLFRQKLLDDKFLVALVIFISLFTESLVFTPFFLLFIFSGLTFFTKKKSDKYFYRFEDNKIE